MQKSTIFGIMSVIGAALIHLSLGYFYTMGNMTPYLIHYMNITKSQSVWFYSVAFSTQALSMPIGGLLAAKIGFRIVTILAIISSSGGVFLSYLSVNAGLGALVTTYGIMLGLGMGLPYSVLFSIASAWFPAHRSAVVGIISSGFGLGALVFTPIQLRLINPDSIPNIDNPDILKRIPQAFLILGGIMLGMQIIGLLLCRQKPADSNSQLAPTDGSKVRSTDVTISKEDTLEFEEIDKNLKEELRLQSVRNYTIFEALKTIDFYIIFIVIFLNVIPITLQASSYKVFGSENKLDDQYLSIIATISSVFNCLGRLIWGFICDKFSFKCPLEILLIIWTILLASFPFINQSGAFKVLFPIWVFALFFTMAGHFVIMPAASTRLFGTKNMPTIYGLLYAATAPSSLGLTAIVSQFEVEGKWDTVFLSCAGVTVIGFILSTFLNDSAGRCSSCTKVCSNACNSCRQVPVEDDKTDEETGSM